MDGERAVLMATDPPYLVDYTAATIPRPGPTEGRRISAAREDQALGRLRRAGRTLAASTGLPAQRPRARPGPRAAVYQFFGMMRAPLVFAAWQEVGLLPHQVLVWDKTRAVLTRCDYMWDYEPMPVRLAARQAAACRSAVRRPRPRPSGRSPRRSRTAGRLHPTQKPVELVRRPIEYHTRAGELLYEPFAGSGTALIAAEMTGRVCYAMELSPAFVDVAVDRWQRFTGRAAS